MGRLYIVDLKVQDKINSIFKEKKENYTNFGLIIGQFTAGKDYVVHVVRTPFVEDGETATSSLSPEKLLSQSLLTHSRQVRQLLTGGMDILGMVVYETIDLFKSSFNQHKQLLYSAYKVIGKFDEVIKVPHIHNHRALIHICSITQKLSCRSFDLTDNKNMGSPAEWRYQAVSDRLMSLSCDHVLRKTIYVRCHGVVVSLEGALDTGLEGAMRDIRDSDIYFGEDLIEVDDEDDEEEDEFIQVEKKEERSLLKMTLEGLRSLVDVGGGGGDRKSGEEDGGGGCTDFNVDLVVNMSKGPQEPLESAQVHRCSSRIVVYGMVAGRAFLHHKTTFGDAVKALKVDLMRSLLTRCEFVCQDLIQSEEDQTDIQLVYESPIRVFANLSPLATATTPPTATPATATPTTTTLQLCDYLFQEETKEDSAFRLAEVLGLPDDPSAIVNSHETFPDTEKLDADMDEMINGLRYHGYKHQCFAPNNDAPVIDLFRDRHQASKLSSGGSRTFAKPLFLGCSVVVGVVALMGGAYWSLKKQVQQMMSTHDS